MTTDLYDALALALGDLSKGDGWATMRQLADRCGSNRWTVAEWIRREVAAGRVEVGRGMAEKIDGVKQRVPVYRVKGGR
jgi:hypothetical protein